MASSIPDDVPAPGTRRPYIDVLRGFAVIFMIGWHAMDAWTRPDHRATAGFHVVLFFAGWAAPLFLFLAGVSVPLAGLSKVASGATREEASWSLQKRGWQVFALAHLFRFQSFVLNPNATWNAILKPDILNILGLSLVATAWCWQRVRSTREAIWWFIAPAVVMVVVLTPWSRQWWWPTLMHPRLEAYIRPVGNFGVFSLFPTVAFVFVGAFVGLCLSSWHHRNVALLRVLVVAGLGAALFGWASSHVPSLLGTSWLDSISLFVIRVGVMTAALGTGGLVMRAKAGPVTKPLVILGQASLLVYWVHVELVYGVFSYPIRRTMPLPVALTSLALLTLAMFLLAKWRMRARTSLPASGP